MTLESSSGGLGLAGWLGVAGFVISFGLAVIRVWETFLRRGRFRLTFVWDLGEEGGQGGPWLTFQIANVGHAPASVQSILFRAKNDTGSGGWAPATLTQDLPLLLNVEEVSQTFRTEAKFGQAALTSGTFVLEVLDGRGRQSVYPIHKLDLSDWPGQDDTSEDSS